MENKVTCQAFCNKKEIDPIPNELKDLKRLKHLIIHRIGRFSKIKGAICNVPIESTDIKDII